MHLLEVFLYELRQFLQIVLWISLPLIIISLSVTTFLHYRRKKKQGVFELAGHGQDYGLVLTHSMQPLLSLKSKPEDNSILIQQYEQQLRQSRDKYHNLERSFRKLQESYSQVISRYNNEDDKEGVTGEMQLLRERLKAYELKIAQLEQALDYIESGQSNPADKDATVAAKQQEIEKLSQELNSTRVDFAKFREETELGIRNTTAAHSNSATMMGTTDNDLMVQIREMLSSAEVENTELKNRIEELNCNEELIKEKNLQIAFLQQQLEQRVKQHQQSDHQKNMFQALIQTTQKELEQLQLKSKSLELGLAEKQQGLEQANQQLQNHLSSQLALEASLGVREEELRNARAQVTDLQMENSNLTESVMNISHKMKQLEEDLSAASQRTRSYEEKWESNNRLLTKIYSEISGTMQKEMLHVSETGSIITTAVDREAEGLILEN